MKGTILVGTASQGFLRSVDDGATWHRLGLKEAIEFDGVVRSVVVHPHDPKVVLAGAEYGTGSSRDWAAKGTYLLGIRAVIAVSFERIHRSNLVGMGVLPLEFLPGQSRESLGLDGTETFHIEVDNNVKPLQQLTVTATREDGKQVIFQTKCRIDTPVEVEYYRHGGILHKVLRDLAKN